MSLPYFEPQVFDKIDFNKSEWEKGEYEQCMFKDCDFSNINLSGSVFSDCTFQDSNLSLAKLVKTGFKQVQFIGSKLLGLRFDLSDDFLFSVHFNHCILNHSSFFRKKLKGTDFLHCKLEEVEFIESDLSHCRFDYSDLRGAKFENTNLEKSDFREAIHYSFDPEKNRVKKARFSMQGVLSLLDKYELDIDMH